MARRFGAHYVFSKPFRMQEMIRAVHQLTKET